VAATIALAYGWAFARQLLCSVPNTAIAGYKVNPNRKSECCPAHIEWQVERLFEPTPNESNSDICLLYYEMHQ